jgi:H+/Cl- antiporter ClcA
MKEATGELNMTLVTIIAIAAVLGFVTFFLPGILDSVGQKWNDAEETQCTVGTDGKTHCTGPGASKRATTGSGS